MILFLLRSALFLLERTSFALLWGGGGGRGQRDMNLGVRGVGCLREVGKEGKGGLPKVVGPGEVGNIFCNIL